MSEELNQAFIDLRNGFKLSLVALVLTIAFSILLSAPLLWLLPNFLLLPLLFSVMLGIWILSLSKRYRGWSSLGLNRISRTLVAGGVLLFVLVFPLTGYWILLGFFPYSVFVLLTAWGTYTFFENRGLGWLEKNYGIHLKPSRTSSLAGIAVVFSACVVFWVFPQLTSPFSSLGIFGVRFLPFFFASPFLMMSCIFTFRNLRYTSK